MNTIRRTNKVTLTAGSAALLCMALALPANAAVILVDNTCSLSDAIRSANENDSVGGCTAGGSAQPDFIALTQDVHLTEASVPPHEGLPAITSDIILLGFNHSITRNSVDSFRIFTLSGGPDGALTIEYTTISGGFTAEPGGGFYVGNGTSITIDRCTVSGNSAESGGGIFNEGGTVIIKNSLVTQNSAAESGAGLEAGFRDTIFNSTFSGNTLTNADEDTGIAINANATANVAVALSTFSGNQSNSASSSTLTSEVGSFSPMDVKSSIIANTGGGGAACGEIASGTPAQLLNKDDDWTCSGSGDLSGFDLVLADNGGPTQTHALLESSNAIDHAGDCGQAQDQRGFPRDPNLCDSGAFEYPETALFEDGFESGDTSAWSETVP